jgi:hypothetical protein
VGVPRQWPLRVWLDEETGVDPASIILAVGTNLPVTLADPRLSWTNDVLTYTPGTNESWGDYGALVAARLTVTDTLGFGVTNQTWSFHLEQEVVLNPNVVLIGTGPGQWTNLTFVAANDTNYVFRYTGAASGLTNGHYLVSTYPANPYKLRVLSVSEDTTNQMVTVATTHAPLAELFTKGSLWMESIAPAEEPGPVRSPKDVCDGFPFLSKSLAGLLLYHRDLDNDGEDEITAKIKSGKVAFDPSVQLGVEFSGLRLTGFHLDVSGTVTFEAVMAVHAEKSWEFKRGFDVVPAQHYLLALTFIGPVPVWLEGELGVEVGVEANLTLTGDFSAGYHLKRRASMSAGLVNGKWGHKEKLTGEQWPIGPEWNLGGSLTAAVYAEPKLAIYLESLVGGSANLKPYLEFNGSAQVNPLQYDLALYAGVKSELAVECRVWDEAWGELPAWTIFDWRTLLWRQSWPSQTNGTHDLVIDLRAYVDGRDWLLIQNHTLRWHHFDFSAPGRHEWANEPTTVSTSDRGRPVMTDRAWLPVWPIPPPWLGPLEAWEYWNYEVLSATFAELAPPLPHAKVTVRVVPVAGTGTVRVVQQPAADNDYLLIVEFDDNAHGGPAWHNVRLEIDRLDE